jgi:two-component system, sensor histidine kinase and response regulator
MKKLDTQAVLFVEDDEDARTILASLLTMRFPQLVFHFAENGSSGLASFKEHLPAIVITDVNMPVMNGIRLAEEINKIAAGVQLIVLTAFSDKTILESACAAGIGIDHYLPKPVDCRKLMLAIQSCQAEIAAQALPPASPGQP